ncbi:MAG: ABC transporter ATP-binding protein [Acidimicrobiia bacterium]|nr:ABC transporter ATP-binding protein [Acidimicrobiia bacterium]
MLIRPIAHYPLRITLLRFHSLAHHADTPTVNLITSSLPDAAPSDEQASSPPAVWARGLTRVFGKQTAVDNVDLAIQPGEFYGLLGQNGAGKTTTIKLIVGLLRPNSGTGGIGEFDTWREPLEVKRRIGVLPEEFNLYERLTGAELLDFTAAMHGLDRTDAAVRRDELLAMLDLEEAAGKLVGDYSRGMRKKVALAAAIIHRPPVLFLDEPFEGVDPVSARLIQGLLRRYTAQGATIVFSSHEMYLVERLCTRIGIMQRGRMVIESTPQELCEKMGVESVEDAFILAVGGDLHNEGLTWLDGSAGSKHV